jgi:twitching motility protein PilU
VLDIDKMLQSFIDSNGSDIYLTVGTAPHFRLQNRIEKMGPDALTDEDIRQIIEKLLTPQGIAEFDATLEHNTAISWNGKARMRLNVFRQRQHSGLVIRRIQTVMPTLESLGLTKVHSDLIMEKRGLILVVGPTGSGKSSTLASMLNYRNENGQGHILTIEDPVEFVHEHKNCIVTHRDVGIDTFSFAIGLKSALRQMPDVIVIGEIRDEETMEHAITFAETGHLCLATLHSNNATQAIERVVNLFPEQKHQQVLLNLSSNLKAILSQRLVANRRNGKTLATEIMLNQGLIKDLIKEGKIRELKDIIEKNRSLGMQSFEQSLLDLYLNGVITEEIALQEADSPANLRMALRELPSAKKPKEFGELDEKMRKEEIKKSF